MNFLKNKKLIIILSILLLLSTLIIFKQYDDSLRGKIGTLAEAKFNNYGNGESSITFDGYALWNDASKQPSIKQYFHVRADISGKQFTCSLIDVWDWGDNVSITGSEPCEVVKYLESEQIAVIKRKDIIFTVTPGNITFVDTKESSNPSGILVPTKKVKY